MRRIETLLKLRLVATLAALLIALGVKAVVSGTGAPPAEKVRCFAFTYEATLKDLPPGTQRARIWMPLATSDAGQVVTLKKVEGPVQPVETRDPEYGNSILYAEISKPSSPTARFSVAYEVNRRQYSGESGPETGARRSAPLERFLRADALVPIDGRMKELADRISAGKKEPSEIARALYDYVFETLRYDKTGTGWGRGDAIWACDAKRGNCTDFHSLFIAMMRAEKIPARFEIGFPIPESAREGEIVGYHCWAEFHVEGQGWVPVDISEAWKAPAKRDFYFGNLDVNRVQFSVGRDMMLSPRQGGEPLNYFIYPYVEVDGKPYTAVDRHFWFRDVSSSAAVTPAPGS